MLRKLMYHTVEYRYSLPFSDLFELKYLFESENTHMQKYGEKKHVETCGESH